MRQTGRAEAGFSLIELLVVVSILSLLSVAATMSLGRVRAVAQDDAALLTATYETQRSLAVHSGAPRGIVVTARGMRVATQEQGRWQVQPQERAWAGRLRVYPEGPPPRFGDPVI
ncbi:MAG TPA: prepilin-type N-terminal cleavage/methylation domain-containing protein, partial [Paracoccaceae bacterium]|nr:prepilin-type N-terminal cleavage/methylation domain-containing protein [Paracoccaceae bacterium]